MTAPGLTKDGIARTINGVAVTTACAAECCEGEEPTQGYILTLCVCDEGSPPAAEFYIAEGTDPLPSVIRVGASSGFPFCYTVAGSLADVTGLTEVTSYETIDSCDECCPPPCCERTPCDINAYKCWWIEKQDPITFAWVPQINVSAEWQYSIDYDCCSGSAGAPKPAPCPTIEHSGSQTLTFKPSGAPGIGDYQVERCGSSAGGWVNIDSSTRLVCGCIVGYSGRALAVDIPHPSACHPTAGTDSTRDIETGYEPNATTCSPSTIGSRTSITRFGPSGCNSPDITNSRFIERTPISCQTAEEETELKLSWTLCQTSSGNFPNLLGVDASGQMTMTVDGVFDCEAAEMIAAMMESGADASEILHELAGHATTRTAHTATGSAISTIDAEVPWLI